MRWPAVIISEAGVIRNDSFHNRVLQSMTAVKRAINSHPNPRWIGTHLGLTQMPWISPYALAAVIMSEAVMIRNDSFHHRILQHQHLMN